jgi:chorismate dehydratase
MAVLERPPSCEVNRAMRPLRLASVPYLNAEPLLWGFRHGPYRDLASIRAVSPSRIPDLLRAGEVDLGLIPAIEAQRLDQVEILPYVCIGAKRRARSVLLVSKVPLDQVRRVALDENSRTSAALLRILLTHRGRRDVAYVERSPSLGGMLRDNDAALLIGDSALVADTEGLVVVDLAAEWHAITGLPFVFAVWGARPDLTLPDGIRPFLDSRQMGMSNIPAIAREAAGRLGLPQASIEEYLRVNLHYHLGSEENRALDLFFHQAHEVGLIAPPRRLALLATGDREPAGAGRGRR